MPAGDWALHGSAPMLAHGLLSEIHDIDIVARGAAWEAAGRLGIITRAVVDLPCVRLEQVLAYKRRLARAKDIPHIALLEALTARRHRGQQR